MGTDDRFVCIFTEKENYALKRLNTISATARLINDHALQKGRNCFSFQRDSIDQRVYDGWR